MTWKLFNQIFTSRILLQIITFLSAMVALKAFEVYG
jgi:hypothetical protein